MGKRLRTRQRRFGGIYLYQQLFKRLAKHFADATAQGVRLKFRAGSLRRGLQQNASFASQTKRNVRPGQDVPLDHLDAAAQLGLTGLEELASGRDVEEQRGDVDGRAAGAGGRLDRQDPATFEEHPGPLPRRRRRGELDLGDRGDRRQRLAAESQGGDLFEVGHRRDLARRVAVEGEESVVAVHAGAVVGDADALPPTPLEVDLEPRRPGVEGVLDQLLDHRRRPLHHLPGGDLRHQPVGQDLDARHEGILLRVAGGTGKRCSPRSWR